MVRAAAAAAAAAQVAVEGLQLGDAEQACALPRGRAKSEADLLEIEPEEAADCDLTLLGGETLSWLQGALTLTLILTLTLSLTRRDTAERAWLDSPAFLAQR